MAGSPRKAGTDRSFRRTASLLAGRIREAGESRGFAVSKVLTHWPEIVGPELSVVTRPVEIRYGRQGLGATLTVLTTGANAPLVEMQKDRLRERVNACYGYAAIAQVRITQTAATGFAEGRVVFSPAPKPEAPRPDAPATRKAQEMAASVSDDALRVALSELGANILSKSKS
jgi:hypothetical protein